MHIYDQRKPNSCPFSELKEGDLFAYQEGEDLFYLMVVDEDKPETEEGGMAVVLGDASNNNYALGRMWSFKFDEEIQPLKGELKVWAQ